MKVRKYKDTQDLETIEDMLYEEYILNGSCKGFWCNIDIIRNNLKDLKVIKVEEVLVGFCLMESNKCTPCILWFHSEHRGKGYGKKVVKLCEKKVMKKGWTKMSVYVTDDSESFWKGLGYEHNRQICKMEKNVKE